MEQTAVEWLVDKLLGGKLLMPSLIEQAKEMERQQIIDARQDGHDSTYAEYGETPKCYLDGSNEQYYNEILKKKYKYQLQG